MQSWMTFIPKEYVYIPVFMVSLLEYEIGNHKYQTIKLQSRFICSMQDACASRKA